MKNRWIVVLVAISLATCTFAQTWIWYPGDYEIWLGNRMNNRRTERGAFFPPFWKTDSHYVVVEFSKQLNLSEPEEIFIAAEGKYNVKLDGKLQFGMLETLLLPAGTHNLNIKVWNQSTPPAIYVKGKTVNSDATWRVTYEDKEWIDESGKASDILSHHLYGGRLAGTLTDPDNSLPNSVDAGHSISPPPVLHNPKEASSMISEKKHSVTSL